MPPEPKLNKFEFTEFFVLIIFILGIIYFIYNDSFNKKPQREILNSTLNIEEQKENIENEIVLAEEKENELNNDIEKKDEEIKMLFLGDVMMDRSIRTRAQTVGYDFYFQCVRDKFANYDFVIINLEGPVTDFISNNLGQLPIGDLKSFQFTMAKEALLAMKNAGIDIFGVANNHIFDYGRVGIVQTKENVLGSNLLYFGDPIDENYRVLIVEKDDLKIALIPFNEFFGTAKETVSDILKYRESVDLIIVFAHWGDEYVTPPERVKKWARDFVDSGADIVIGHHPHVVQEFEYFKDKPIFYSLGNFVFDQYWEEAVRNGGAAEIVIKNKEVLSAQLLNLKLDAERRPCIEE